MNCKIKKLFMVMLTVALSFCMLITLGAMTANADVGQAPTTTTYTFTMNERVSTKILYADRADDGVRNAIRFTSAIEKNAIDDNADSFDVKVKTIIAKTEALKALDGKDFTKTNIDDYNASVEESEKIKYQEVVFSEGYNLTLTSNDTSYVFNACLYNVKDENYTQSLSAISYLEINGVATQYTNAISGNLWDTADTHRQTLDGDGDAVVDDSGYDQEELDFVSTLCKTYDVTLNTESIINKKHGQYLTTDDIKSKVNVDGYTYFDGTIDVDVSKPVISDMAVTVGVGELEYSLVDAEGASVTDVTAATGYKVTKGTLASLAADTTIKIPEQHNGMDVTTIGAFSTLSGLKKFIATKSTVIVLSNAFSGCSKLEYVAIPGVTSLAKSSSAQNAFLSCKSLNTLIVGANFTPGSTQHFTVTKNDTYNAIVDVYTIGDANHVTLKTNNNNVLLSGNIYSYDERGICNTWKYTDDGDDVILNETQHNYNGEVCTNCNMLDTNGVNYTYDATADAYYVSGNISYNVEDNGPILRVAETYDDGINGSKSVVGVKNSAFNNRTSTRYNGVTHVVLPESVTTIESSAFWNATTLEFVSMLGVTAFPDRSDNQFYNANALKQVLITKSLSYTNSAFGISTTYSSGYTAQVDIFAMEAGGTVSNLSNDKMRTGNTYTYDENLYCGLTWKYEDEDNYIIKKAEPSHNYDADGKCEYCGQYDGKGINYVFVEGQGYYVTTNTLYDASTYGSILKVANKFNDGINGEAPVVGVKGEAFNSTNETNVAARSYVGVTHIILPESVTILESSAFYRSSAVYISMLGVNSFPSGTENHFLRCNSLKTLVVNSSFTNNVSQSFVSSNASAVIDIYVYGEARDIEDYKGRNNNDTLLSGKVYSYSAEDPGEDLQATTWRYDEDGYAILWSDYLTQNA